MPATQTSKGHLVKKNWQPIKGSINIFFENSNRDNFQNIKDVEVRFSGNFSKFKDN